jgi:hypothetical protein
MPSIKTDLSAIKVPIKHMINKRKIIHYYLSKDIKGKYEPNCSAKPTKTIF